MSLNRLIAHDGACLTFHSGNARAYKNNLLQLLSYGLETLRQFKLDASCANTCPSPLLEIAVSRARACTLPYKKQEKRGFQRGSCSDKLHLGSGWPVSSRINLSLKPHVFLGFAILARSSANFLAHCQGDASTLVD